MKKKWIAAALAAVMTLGLWGCTGDTDTTVYVENVGVIVGGGSIAIQDKFPGLVVSENLAEVWRDSNQIVANVYVEQGQDVTKGELLFAYDSEAMSLEQSKLELERDRLNNTVTTLKTQITQLQNEQKKADKDDQLSYTIEIQDRQAQLKEAEYNVKAKNKEIEQIKAALNNAKIYAPVDGRVVSVNESGYDANGNAAPYITIQQSGSFRIKGTINEMNMGAIVEGATILVTARTNSDQTWMGVVSTMDLESATQNSTQGDYLNAYDTMTSSSSYAFYVDLENTDGLILGQHVYLEIYHAPTTPADGLWLPEYYLCYDEMGDSYVWAEDKDERLEMCYVTLGGYDENSGSYEILDGLTKEDHIAFPSEYCESGAHTTKNAKEAVGPTGSESTEGNNTMDETAHTDETYDNSDMSFGNASSGAIGAPTDETTDNEPETRNTEATAPQSGGATASDGDLEGR